MVTYVNSLTSILSGKEENNNKKQNKTKCIPNIATISKGENNNIERKTQFSTPKLTTPDDGLYGDVTSINLPGKLANGLVRILVGVRVHVGADRAVHRARRREQRHRHWRHRERDS